MLTSSARSVADYRSIASDVRMQVAELRIHGSRSRPSTEDVSNVETIRELLRIGGRYIEQPNGNLDINGSSPENFDLAKKLKNYIVAPNVTEWTNRADNALRAIEETEQWDQVAQEQRTFIEDQLEPFLIRVLRTAADESEE